MSEASVRTLTVACTSGLSNRLRVLLSGMALAEASGRRFTMYWPRTKECAASFTELFSNAWSVTNVSGAQWANLRENADRERVKSDLLRTETPHLYFWTSHTLVMPHRYPAHEPLLHRMAELLADMHLSDDVMGRVVAFTASVFRPRMVGVHLRRGDMRVLEPIRAHNTTTAMQAVDAYLVQSPYAGILLCTDDGAPNQYTGQPLPAEGVRAKFVQRYGERVVSTTPRSLDRSAPIAIQDALVDLWLLRQTDFFVGTAGSSFSDMVMLGRSVPVTVCQSQHPLRYLLPLRIWLRGERTFSWLARYYWRIIRPRAAR